MSIQIYDPTTEVSSRKINFVPRPKSLKGLRIGLVSGEIFQVRQFVLATDRELGSSLHGQAAVA